MFLPRGAVIADELETLAKETEFAAGYQRVRTPHIARESLYRKSGHLPYYAESMFPPMELYEDRQLREKLKVADERMSTSASSWFCDLKLGSPEFIAAIEAGESAQDFVKRELNKVPHNQ